MNKITDQRKIQISRWTQLIHTLGIFGILGLLLIVGTFVSDEFWTIDNFLNIIRPVTLLGIVAVGVAFITYGGHYVDLSIPGIMALSGMAAVAGLPYGIVPGILCGLSAGLLVGIINGYLIGYLRLNPIIWTLAMGFMIDGLLRFSTGGNQVYPDDTTSAGQIFVLLSRFEWLGLPGISIIFLAAAVMAQWVLSTTKFGFHVQLTGAAYDVAGSSGIHVKRIIMMTFVISAFMTSVAGILLASLSRQGTFTNGLGYDFNAITAVVLGGIALSGGIGSVIGVMGGVLVLGLLGNILTLYGWSTFDQMIAKGLIFICVVGTATWFAKRSGREDV